MTVVKRNVIGQYYLPVDVRFCRKCTISNQQAWSYYAPKSTVSCSRLLLHPDFRSNVDAGFIPFAILASRSGSVRSRTCIRSSPLIFRGWICSCHLLTSRRHFAKPASLPNSQIQLYPLQTAFDSRASRVTELHPGRHRS